MAAGCAGPPSLAPATDILLSRGSESPVQQEATPVAEGRPLSPEEREAVLRRLPPFLPDARDQEEFRLPPETLPAPRPGATVELPFPPPEEARLGPVVEAGPLQVLRYSPKGDVATAPFLSVTFDQPMVPLTTQQELAARDVPVRLSPAPEGEWRWVGTRTLVFQPAFRFSKATAYDVEIPAGTRSAAGGKLEESLSWTFTLLPPRLETSHPGVGPQMRQPLLFAAFDQRIDPTKVLETVRVRAAGRTFPAVLATQEEIRADSTVAALAESAAEGYWLAFRPTELLPGDARVIVEMGPGIPSAEGPQRTEDVQSFTFATYGPLRVTGSWCALRGECPPGRPWTVRFINPLDEESFHESLVDIQPPMEGVRLALFGNHLQIQGRSQGRTTYRVTLKEGIRDVFGQRLGHAETVTFQVGSAEPSIFTGAQPLVVLDPAGRPTFSVFTVNYGALRVRAYAVQPQDWPAYLEHQRLRLWQNVQSEPPGRLVMDERVAIHAVPDEITETSLDLGPALKDGLGHVILVAEPLEPLASLPPGNRGQPPPRVWIQSTRIGLGAFVHGGSMLAWASDLVTGSPLSGVTFSVHPDGETALSGDEGLGRLSLRREPGNGPESPGRALAGPFRGQQGGIPEEGPDPQPEETGAFAVATLGDDTALLPRSLYYWHRGSGWGGDAPGTEALWYVFDDRAMYRPGEEVHLKGWIRLVDVEVGGEAFALPRGGSPVTYHLMDARGNQLLSDTLRLNALGGFHTSFALPENMNLGRASVRLTLGGVALPGASWQHSFQVQEFRRPEFEVSARASDGPHFAGQHAITTVEAKYYAGGPLPQADVTWQVTSRPGSFRPPNRVDFSFGIWVPWWRPVGPQDSPRPHERRETFEGTTDADGVHNLRIDFAPTDPPQPRSVTAQATVMDVNRQAWSASAQLLVHPADLYVGLRTATTFVQRGDPLEVDAIVTDLDGNAVEDRPIRIRAVRLEWAHRGGRWVQEEKDEQPCEVGSEPEPVRCTFRTLEGGTYRITATVSDGHGRPNLTEITRWVSGGRQPSAPRVGQEEAPLIPDRQEYQPGEVAEILVQAPFAPAEGLLTLRRAGIVHTERFRMEEATHTLRVEMTEAHIPNVHVQVDLVGGANRLDRKGETDPGLPPRPAYARGTLNLSVPAHSRTLSVQATPRSTTLEPGGETTVDVLVTDAAGRPVPGAEVAVVVVDEAVLALTGYSLADPVAAFYRNRPPGVSDHHLRAWVILADPDEVAREEMLRAAEAAELDESLAEELSRMPAVALDQIVVTAEAGAGEEKAVRLRREFTPLATFAPEVPTDAGGRGAVRVELPDNLTRYRVMAVAVAGDKEFGKGESTITARLPLMVRPSAPRFLNFGDRFELPVVVQNQTDGPMEVDVAVRATNVEPLGSQGVRITVPANDRREVRFPFATSMAGTARFQAGAVSGPRSDAAEVSLPVYTPATTEAFAVYGTLDDGAVAQPVLVPGDAYPQFGGLDISTSSTALQALTGAILHLTSYPFEGSEQVASRILAVAALRDVLGAFQAEGLPSPEELVKAVQRDVELLRSLQNRDGGFPLWQRERDSWPFHSIHATHALVRARDKGFTVPEEMLSAAQDYLRVIERHYPVWYRRDVRNTLTAYALFVRKLMGDGDLLRARRLLDEEGPEGLQPEALGFLLRVMTGDPGSATQLGRLRRHLGNRVVETAGMANFVASYREEDGYLLLASNRRGDGIILEALMVDDPESDLIPKLVAGLLAHRKGLGWRNTQENVFILLALDRYFSTFEAQTPEFVARAWLGDDYVGAFPFEGRTTEHRVVKVPMSFLVQGEGSPNLVLGKEGPGRLYYRLGMTYAPMDLHLEAMDRGFTVTRTYEGVDDAEDVRRDDDGVWHVRAGARVRVQLTMVAPSRRYHVALADPMPAGFEAMNPALAVTGEIPRDPGSPAPVVAWWRPWTWYEHQNLRDQRVEAFASLLWDGIHTYTYVARATTPGEFVVPPARAEEMYSPEVFGRSSTDRVVVK